MSTNFSPLRCCEVDPVQAHIDLEASELSIAQCLAHQTLLQSQLPCHECIKSSTTQHCLVASESEFLAKLMQRSNIPVQSQAVLD